ncbi:MAG: hypothetical protein O7D97_08850 [Planctomycetota bacterium]|nr:hypothetical protein [Planctomycetota bacterium]
MPRHSLSQWVSHLRAIAAPAATAPPVSGTASIERPFAAVVCGLSPGPLPDPIPPAEVGLWWALVETDIEVDPLLEEPTEGSLWPHGRFTAIEVWTEAELCGLHALWGLARLHNRDDWARRAITVRDWHLHNTQPDNATNRPWSLHVFLLAETPEAYHYAETLLHNAMVTTGRPELLSAWILLDSAKQLEAVVGR